MKTDEQKKIEELLNSELETIQGGAGSCICDNGGAGQIVVGGLNTEEESPIIECNR